MLRVVGAAIVERHRLLLVSKRSAPTMFYLPGGKPDPGEKPLACLRRELQEELTIALTEARFLARVSDVAANEGVPMEMLVYLTSWEGEPRAAQEISQIAWFGDAEPFRWEIAPAVRNQVIPRLRAKGLLAES
jgi:8-oxo-dGTP diphosphatase